VTGTAIALCILCQALIVAGQILLKRGISGKKPRAKYFILGIGCMTAWFFLWLGLMGKWDLSKLFPFEGLNPAIMAVCAWLVLKEKLSPGAWAGMALVCAGVMIVIAS
jgi:drug/metabolite transporter (DMT)-like permease